MKRITRAAWKKDVLLLKDVVEKIAKQVFDENPDRKSFGIKKAQIIVKTNMPITRFYIAVEHLTLAHKWIKNKRGALVIYNVNLKKLRKNETK